MNLCLETINVNKKIILLRNVIRWYLYFHYNDFLFYGNNIIFFIGCGKWTFENFGQVSQKPETPKQPFIHVEYFTKNTIYGSC